MKHRRATAGPEGEFEIEWEVTDPGGEPSIADHARLHRSGRGALIATGLIAAVLTGMALLGGGVGRTRADPPAAGVDPGNGPVRTPFVSPPRPGPGQVTVHLVMSETLGGGDAVCHEFTGEIGPGDARMITARWRTSDGDSWVFAPDDRQSVCCLPGDSVKWITLTSEDGAGEPLAEARFTVTC